MANRRFWYICDTEMDQPRQVFVDIGASRFFQSKQTCLELVEWLWCFVQTFAIIESTLHD